MFRLLRGADEGELLRLLCHCRGSLATCHTTCAERWFRRRGKGDCELCGVLAFVLAEKRVEVDVYDRPRKMIVLLLCAISSASRPLT